MRLFSKTAVLAVLIVGYLSTISAHAVATLRISGNGGVNWIKVRDGNEDGMVAYNGSVGGTAWSISVGAGTTKPAIGSAIDPIMQLSSATVSSSSAGTLILEFSETFYGPLPDGNSFTTSLESDNIGTGRTTIWSYLSTANTLFDKGELLGVIVETGPDATSTVNSGGLFGYGEFSLTVRIAIRHSGADSTSFSASLVDPPPASVPDGGSTVVLLGLALLVLGGSAAWMKRVQKA